MQQFSFNPAPFNRFQTKYIYIIKQDIRINICCLCCSLTAGPIGLKFFVDTHEWPGGVIG